VKTVVNINLRAGNNEKSLFDRKSAAIEASQMTIVCLQIINFID